MKNIIDHDALWPEGDDFTTEDYAKAALCEQMNTIVATLGEVPTDDWKEAFGTHRKAQIPVLFVAHSAFYVLPEYGGRPFPMPLKVMKVHLLPAGDPVGSMKLANALNHYMQPLI